MPSRVLCVLGSTEVTHLVVDLSQAMSVVGSRVRLHGSSDATLVRRVRQAPNFVSTRKGLSAAAGLDGGIILRPVEGLHWLSYATSPRYQDDLLDLYMHWALVRYIGLFERRDGGPAGAALAVACLVSGSGATSDVSRPRKWALGSARCWRTAGPRRPAQPACDRPSGCSRCARRSILFFAGGSRHRVRAVADRRPDYLLTAPDPTPAGATEYAPLNARARAAPPATPCSSWPARSSSLLVSPSAAESSGIAVSTITANDRMSYLAIDPGEEEEPSYEVNSATIAQAASFQLGDDVTDVLRPFSSMPRYVHPGRRSLTSAATSLR